MDLKFTSKMRIMSSSTFKLYVYIVEASEHVANFTLSRSHALEHTGLAKTTYYESLDELCSIGFMKKVGCHYILAGDVNG